MVGGSEKEGEKINGTKKKIIPGKKNRIAFHATADSAEVEDYQSEGCNQRARNDQKTGQDDQSY